MASIEDLTPDRVADASDVFGTIAGQLARQGHKLDYDGATFKVAGDSQPYPDLITVWRNWLGGGSPSPAGIRFVLDTTDDSRRLLTEAAEKEKITVPQFIARALQNELQRAQFPRGTRFAAILRDGSMRELSSS